MLSALFLAAAFTANASGVAHADPLDDAIAHFRTVETYRVTIRSTHAAGEEHLRYYYRRPGFVRMEFIRPHQGAVMIFSPDTGRVLVWPFGMGSVPRLSLSPENSIIRSLSGMRVDRSDVGRLFENIRILRESGNSELLNAETMEGRTVLHLLVTGGEGVAVAGVHSTELWLDEASRFPVKVISRDMNGDIIETVAMEGLEVNGELAERLFSP